MLAVLRIKNIIADRAAPELTAKLGGSFLEVRRNLDRAVVFYELHSAPAQILDVFLARHFQHLHGIIDNIQFHTVIDKTAD